MLFYLSYRRDSRYSFLPVSYRLLPSQSMITKAGRSSTSRRLSASAPRSSYAMISAGEQCACAADCTKVNCTVFFHCSNNFRASLTFSDHASLTEFDHGWGICIHTVAGGWTCRTDNLIAFCRSRTYIVDDRILWIKWQFFALFYQFAQTFVSCVSCCIDDSRN